MIYHGKVTLDVDIDISAYDMGASGKQVASKIHSIDGRMTMGVQGYYAYKIFKDAVFETLTNDDPGYNEAIEMKMTKEEG